eukprot:TRINITY_DN3857_c0_g1_i2.p1 TRINITY_DN3857_c0_g1~~TRINITY_DN3857_c0_g1_i2.p1  ORF type:complete len:560 (-),score=104.56 TRINITY_DN3857_c0_g1_i2:62-1741(-)
MLDLESKFLRPIGTPDVFENLKKVERIKCPVLILTGEQDTDVPKPHAKKIAKKIPNIWRSVELEGCGHHDMEGSTDFNDALLDFFDYILPEGKKIKVSQDQFAHVPDKFKMATGKEEVTEWAKSLGLEKYGEVLAMNGYEELTYLEYLKEIDLRGMGITNPDHIAALLQGIEKLKAGTPPIAETKSKTDAKESSNNKDEAQPNQARKRKDTQRMPFTEVVAVLKKMEVDWDKEVEPGALLKKGFFEEVRCGMWKGKTVVTRNMTSKQHQRELFCRQVCALCELKHENLLLPIAVCTKSPALCIITEFMEGGNLYDFLHSKEMPMTSKLQVSLAMQITKALHYLHSQLPAMVHRDLTSRNVLLSKDLRVRVSDFGLNRPPSFLWMAPEIFITKHCTVKSDIFSLGVILWEIVTRKVPYKGKQPAVAAMDVAKKGYRLPIQRDRSPKGEAWGNLIEKCWQQEPESRPTAAEVLAILGEIEGLIGEEKEEEREAEEVEEEETADGASSTFSSAELEAEVEDVLREMKEVLAKVREIKNEVKQLEHDQYKSSGKSEMKKMFFT